MHEVNGALLDWWTEQCRVNGRCPDRRDLDPADLKRILKHLFMADREPSGRFRFSIYGTYIADGLGEDCTGQLVGQDTFGDRWERIDALYGRVSEGRKPILSREQITGRSGLMINIEVLHVPLARPDCSNAKVLGSYVRLRERNIPPRRNVLMRDIGEERNALIWEIESEVVTETA